MDYLFLFVVNIDIGQAGATLDSTCRELLRFSNPTDHAHKNRDHFTLNLTQEMLFSPYFVLPDEDFGGRGRHSVG